MCLVRTSVRMSLPLLAWSTSATPASCSASTCRRPRRCARRCRRPKRSRRGAAVQGADRPDAGGGAVVAGRGRSCCVCDLAWIVGREEKLVSHHVRLLKSLGVARSRRDGRMVMYELTELGDAPGRRVPRSGTARHEPDRAADGAARAASLRRPRPPGRARFRVEGMDCGACAKTVEQAVAALAGVDAAQVSFGNGTLAVDGEAPDARITGAVARAGYRAQPAARRAASRRDAVLAARRPRALDDGRGRPAARRRGRLAGVGAARGVPSRCTCCRWRSAAGRSRARPCVAAAPPAAGHERADGAGRGRRGRHRRVRRGRVGARAVRGRHGAGGDGARAQPPHGRVADGPRARAGARAGRRRRAAGRRRRRSRPARGSRSGPASASRSDARGRRGASSVDQAPITGESVPVDKRPATSCSPARSTRPARSSSRVTRPAADSTLSRVASLVEEAQGSRAPAERFIDRFARDLHAARLRRRAAARHGPARCSAATPTPGSTARSRC